jgi:F0F1-type ATP synthase assembly protein I
MAPFAHFFEKTMLSHLAAILVGAFVGSLVRKSTGKESLSAAAMIVTMLLGEILITLEAISDKLPIH